MAAAVCCRLLADVGAGVTCIDPDGATLLADYLNHGKDLAEGDAVGRNLAAADLIVCEGRPRCLRARGHDPDALRRCNPRATLVHISPYGLTGPNGDDPASDLTLHFSSGIARLLTGQVDDPGEPPIRPVGEQSAFIGGLAAACSAMHAALLGAPAAIDVAIEEALATMAIGELANAGLHGKIRQRKRAGDGDGATATILPASDGYVRSRRARTVNGPHGSRCWGRRTGAATRALRPKPIALSIGAHSIR
jgi:crotonobetainyl-CoA:carnitine CoA-transferase CaiB-like acyl-CoA transferase